MNLVTFCENRYQELSERAKNSAYDILIDSETMALKTVLQTYRKCVYLAHIPKVLFDFGLVNIELKDAPLPVMTNVLKMSKVEEIKEVKQTFSDFCENEDDDC
jgi:hypothetical protein